MATSKYLVDILTRAQVYLERAKAGVAQEFDPELSRYIQAITERLRAENRPLSQLTPAEMTRLVKELFQAEQTIIAPWRDDLTATLRDVAGHEAAFAQQALTEAVVGDLELAAISQTQAWQAALTNPVQATGKLLQPFVQEMTKRGVLEPVERVVRTASAQGWTMDETIRAVRGTKARGYADGIAAGMKRSVDAIVRTAIQHTSNTARGAIFEANADIVTGERWIATLDKATCLRCAGLDLRVFPLGKGPRPPAHLNCVLPGALVAAGGVSAQYERWFDGEVVCVSVEGHDDLTVTPNHPVLTGRGWIAAGELREGDHLIESRSPALAVLAVDPDHGYVEARIEEAADALRMAGEVLTRRVPVAAEDFHGDGIIGEDVHVVRTDCALEFHGQAAPTNSDGDVTLARPDLRERLFSGSRAAGEFLGGAASPAGGGVGRGGEGQAFRSGGARHPLASGFRLGANREPLAPEGFVDHRRGAADLAREVRDPLAGHVSCVECGRALGRDDAAQSVGLPSSAPRKSSLRERASDDLDGHAALLCETLHALAGHVSAVKIRQIRKHHFAGHVFNLETRSGWYFANGLIVHNCRCVTVPELDDSLALLGTGTRASKGAKGGAQVPASQSYWAWLKQQPAAFQDDAIGPSRGKLLRNGGLSAEEFARLNLGRNFEPMTLGEMRGKSPQVFDRAGVE